MKVINVINNTTEDKATKIFNAVCKTINPYDERVLPYMGGNKFELNSYSVGLEIDNCNIVVENLLFVKHTIIKFIILKKNK